MATIKLGQTPAQVEAEAAAKQNAMLEERQETLNERQRELLEITKKNKRKTILTTIAIVVVTLSFLGFGVYTTFFKHTLDENDVQNIVQTSTVDFNSAGLTDFIRESLPTWLENSTQVASGAGVIEIKPDLDSVTIERVTPIDDNTARVYFKVNLISTMEGENDSNPTVTNRYRMYIPIEIHYEKDDDGKLQPVGGYRPIAPLSLCSIEPLNTAEVSDDKETINANFKFDEDSKVEEAKLEPVKVKISNILDDLYAGKDTSQDYKTYYTFNPDGCTFKGLTAFEYYSKANKMGYNAVATYTVETKEGITFTNTTYFAVRQNGDSYKIVGML